MFPAKLKSVLLRAKSSCNVCHTNHLRSLWTISALVSPEAMVLYECLMSVMVTFLIMVIHLSLSKAADKTTKFI